jgi:hypothetical protein
MKKIFTVAMLAFLLGATHAFCQGNDVKQEPHYLRGCIMQKRTLDIDSATTTIDTTSYNQTFVRLMKVGSKEVFEIPTDQDGCYKIYSLEKGAYRLFIADPFVGNKFVYLKVNVDDRNTQLKPIIVDRESKTVKVMSTFKIPGRASVVAKIE